MKTASSVHFQVRIFTFRYAITLAFTFTVSVMSFVSNRFTVVAFVAVAVIGGATILITVFSWNRGRKHCRVTISDDDSFGRRKFR